MKDEGRAGEEPEVEIRPVLLSSSGSGFILHPSSFILSAPVSLPELRVKIDEVDASLIRLLNERAALVREVGRVKREGGLDIYAPEREESLLRALTERNAAEGAQLPPESLRAIYREIMSASLALEKDLRIAYLGPEATWTHQAARGKFGASVRYVSQANVGDVFDAVARDRADYGVVPIENSTEGAVNHTLDVFIDSELLICAQLTLRIEHHLMAKIPRAAIRRVFSHPQVFGQCRHWLNRHLPGVDQIEVSSTSRAGELAAHSTDAAALAGPMVAELHGLDLLDSGVQDSAHNTTRFLVIGHRDCPPTGSDRTSLMFAVPDRAGSLFMALEPLQNASVSMSKIESRPSKRKPWEYVFFVDVEGHREDAVLVGALRELETRCTFLKVLGSYPNLP